MHLWELNLSFAQVMTRGEQDGVGEEENPTPSGDMGCKLIRVLSSTFPQPAPAMSERDSLAVSENPD